MYHKDPETDSSRIVGFEVTPNRFSTIFFLIVKFTFVLVTVEGKKDEHVCSLQASFSFQRI